MADKNVQSKPQRNEELWEQARNSAIGANGGFAGVSKEGQDAQIQAHYDQMVANDKQTKEWAGHEDGQPSILGDI